MFEDRTYQNIMAECLNAAPEGIDIRQGGIFYDAVASAAMKIAMFYADLQTVFDLVFISTAVGEYLDRRGAEYGVMRLPATNAQYGFNFTGAASPAVGERFFDADPTGGLYFVLQQNSNDNSYFLQAETAGIVSNNILTGTPAVPVNNIAGLDSASFGALLTPGSDEESDDRYRARIMAKISDPDRNGTRQHYKVWAESIAGVGRARIFPLFAGMNTVMAVIIGTDGLPAAASIVAAVQEYIDPITLNNTAVYNGQTVTVGDGLGDGVANIGAHLYAVAPERVDIDVSFTVELSAGYTADVIQAAAVTAFTEFLKELVLNTPDGQVMTVRVSAVSNLLYGIDGLIDYTNLTLNGDTANITFTDTQVPACGNITVDS